MKPVKSLHLFLSILLCLSFSLASEEIEVWHAFDGYLGEVFHQTVQAFNQRNPEQQVKLKGFNRYDLLIQQGLESQNLGKGPQLLQVYEVATTEFMQNHKLSYLPVDELMMEQGYEWGPERYIEAVRANYITSDNRLLSLPWNASTGVLYFNIQAFKKAGLDPLKPPQTWQELHHVCQRLKEVGIGGFTTAWPAAYHLEHFCAIHGLAYASESGELLFNREPAVQQHWERLSLWQTLGYFIYGGRFNDVEDLFINQDCALLMQGANRYGLLARRASFAIGAAPLPYDENVCSSPQPPLIGGASFWALQGASDEQQAVMAAFLHYLTETDVQHQWHLRTGYLPCTYEAAALCCSQENPNPAGPIAIQQVVERNLSSLSRAIRLPNYMAVRNHILDCFEAFLQGRVSAQEALDQAVLP